MISVRITSVIAVALLCGTCARSAPMQITRVQVLDAQFRVVRTLSSELELQQFSEQWEQRVETGQTSAQISESAFQYKLDVSANRGGGRWLYNPTGLVFKLDPKA